MDKKFYHSRTTPVKLIMGNIAGKIKFWVFSISAGMAKVFYLIYLSTLLPGSRLVNPQYFPDRSRENINAIYVFWHSKTFILMPMFGRSRMAVLTLADWKNYFYDKLCRSFGHRTIPVTSPSSAARNMMKAIEEGFNAALALDGPRGPEGVVRPGAIYLAMRTKRPIVPINIKPAHSIRLKNRWDRYEIPLPFTKTVFTAGEPIYAAGKTAEEVEGELKRRLTDH